MIKALRKASKKIKALEETIADVDPEGEDESLNDIFGLAADHVPDELSEMIDSFQKFLPKPKPKQETQ